MELEKINGKTSIKDGFVNIYNSNNELISNEIESLNASVSSCDTKIKSLVESFGKLNNNTIYLKKQLEELDTLKSDVSEMKNAIDAFKKYFGILVDKGYLPKLDTDTEESD